MVETVVAGAELATFGGVDLSGKTEDDALATLREAVAEKGADYIYTTPEGVQANGNVVCSYVHNGGEPGCIVGNVLHRWGVGLDALLRIEGSTATILGSGVWHDGRTERYLSRPVAGVLVAAQRAQDRGEPWGMALALAEEEASRAGAGATN